MLIVASFANVNHPGLINLQNSIQKQGGWHHEILGTNVAWKGWMTRMKAYQNYCASLPKNQLVVLCDAFDVLCIRNGLPFESIFEQMFSDKQDQQDEKKDVVKEEIQKEEKKEPPEDNRQRKIVIGVETGCDFNCYPPKNYYLKNNIDELLTNRRFVNGGLMAGYAGDLDEMWVWCISKGFDDDQVALGHYVDTFPERICLDMHSNLFFNDHLAETTYTFCCKENRIVYENQVLTPFFVHFHGLNINTSVPFFNIFKKEGLFQVGHNYKLIGNHINGDKQINQFPPDKRGLILGVTIERGVYIAVSLAFLLLLLFFLVVLFQRKIYTKKKVN